MPAAAQRSTSRGPAGALAVVLDELRRRGLAAPRGRSRVDTRERRHSLGTAPLPVELLAERRQLVEGVARGAYRVVVELRERLHELLGEPRGLDVLTDLGLAQPVQQPQQLVVLRRVPGRTAAARRAACTRAPSRRSARLRPPPRPAAVPWRAGRRRPPATAPRRPGPGTVKYHDVAVRADWDARIPTPHVMVSHHRRHGAGELHPQVAGAVLAGVAVEHQPQQARVVARGRRHPLPCRRRARTAAASPASWTCPRRWIPRNSSRPPANSKTCSSYCQTLSTPARDIRNRSVTLPPPQRRATPDRPAPGSAMDARTV